MMSHQRWRWRQRFGASLPSPPTRQTATPTFAQSTSRRGSVRPIRDRYLCPPPPKPESCMQIMDIVQYMCRTVEILFELGCTILVLTPKGNIDTRGIGILKTLWKVVEAIINTQLQASIQFHYVLHGFRSGRGSGMVTVDINISKQLFQHQPRTPLPSLI